MISNKAALVAIVGAGCIGAAGIGSYLAVRANSAGMVAAPTAVASTEPSAAVADQAPAPTEAPEVTPSASAPVAAAARPAPERQAAPAPPRVTQRAEIPAAVEARPVPDPAAVPTQADYSAPAAGLPVVDLPEPPPSPLVAVTLEENTVIGIRLDRAISSETAEIEDRVTGLVARDVTVDGRVAVPAGSEVRGYVTEVVRGGAFRERARLGVRFTTVLLPDGTLVDITTDAIYRDGEAPGGEATTKIGASAAVGAVIGAIIGGGKGAAIGGSAGAAGGTAAVAAGGANAATLAAGTPLTIELTEPVTLLVERVPE